MAKGETARMNHDELFPGHVSILAEKDPEFIDVFDNFAFDEVLQYTSLGVKERQQVLLASLIAMQCLNEFKAMAKGALNVGVTPVEVKEIVYQAVPYAGLGKVFDFLHAINEVLEERGITLPLEGQSTTTVENRFEKGLDIVREAGGGWSGQHAGHDAGKSEAFRHFPGGQLLRRFLYPQRLIHR